MRRRNFDSTAFASLFLAANGHADSTGKVDANEAGLFGRALEVIMAETFDVKYIEAKARTLVPIDRSVDPGANSVTWRQYDAVGGVSFVDGLSSDFPSVEISGAEYTSKFADIGNSYQYSIQDWRAAKFANFALDARKATAARDVMERFLESIICAGDAKHNMQGLANAANVTVVSAPASGKVWLPTGGGTTATALEVYSDLNALAKKVSDDTKMVETIDTLLFPTKLYSYIRSTLFAPTLGSVKTILEAFLEGNPWIKHVDVWSQLDNMGTDSKGRIVGYKRDPRVLRFMMSQDFESMPPVADGWEFKVKNHMRFGGVQVYYPRAMIYLDGAGGTDA